MDTYENPNPIPQPLSPLTPVEEPLETVTLLDESLETATLMEESFDTATLVEEPAPAEPVIPQSAAEPVYSQPEAPQPAAYRGAGAGRKESPYANSPYVMQHQPQPEPITPPKAPKPKKAKKHPGAFRKVLAAVLVLALMIGSSCVTAALVNMRWDDRMYDTEQYFSRQIADLQKQIDSAAGQNPGYVVGSVAPGEGMTPAQIYAQSVNSVVAISTTVKATGAFGQVTEGTSAGSGFILTANGYVVTNYHVVEGASSVHVITHDGTDYPATLVGYDSANDVAVLKVEAQGLPAVTVGSSNNMIIGDMVVAIGNPLGELASTQTVGYVSGIGREVSTDGLTSIRMIQTDAAINPGNSGGPLFNTRGEVIGITTAKYSGTTASGASIEGIGFAIPIDDVMGMINDLVDYGYVTGAYLGVSVSNTDPSATAMFGLPNGAQVLEVVSGVSAHRAGVQVNDIIIALGEYEVTNVTTLTRALRNFKAGDTTTITVVRGGAEKVLTITLDEKPRDLTSPTTPAESMPDEGSYEEWRKYFFGE